MKNKTQHSLDAAHALIRAGELAKARSAIQGLCRVRMPRPEALRLAFLAREAYMPEKALAILHRVVRGVEAGKRGATDEEKAEYGMALADLGAGREAIELLAALDIRKYPRIFRGLTVAYFRSWEWELAIPICERFLGRSGATLHDKLWGEFRLAVALLHGKDDVVRSGAILEKLLLDTKTHDYQGLHSQAIYVLAQQAYLFKDYKRSSSLLELLKATEISSPDSSMGISVAQLRIEILLATAKNKTSALRALRGIRDRYAALGRWEQARGCDYSEAYVTHEAELATHLYFGTPYPNGRKKILRSCGLGAAKLPPHYDWTISDPSPKSLTFDLANGTNSLNSARLKAGDVLLRTLRALSVDFYAPPSVLDLYSRIYPGHHFNPATSPLQVRQALWRLRRWLDAKGLPLEVHEHQGVYTLRSPSHCVIRVSACESLETREQARLRDFMFRIRKKFGAREFSANDTADFLDVSRRSAIEFLKGAATQQLGLERMGAGPSTRYRLKV